MDILVLYDEFGETTMAILQGAPVPRLLRTVKATHLVNTAWVKGISGTKSGL